MYIWRTLRTHILVEAVALASMPGASEVTELGHGCPPPSLPAKRHLLIFWTLTASDEVHAEGEFFGRGWLNALRTDDSFTTFGSITSWKKEKSTRVSCNDGKVSN